MPPKPSKWMINKTNLALPGNKGFHSGNFSPGNHFHRGHSSWHKGQLSRAPAKLRLRGRPAMPPHTERVSAGTNPALPLLAGISPSQSPSGEHALSLSPLRTDRSPRDAERVAVWFCWSHGKAPLFLRTGTARALGRQQGRVRGPQTHPEQTRLTICRRKKRKKYAKQKQGKGQEE